MFTVQWCAVYTVNNKAMQEETVMVFADLLETTKIFPINFISAILSAKISYAKSYFHSCQKQNHDKIKWTAKVFFNVTFIVYNICLHVYINISLWEQLSSEVYDIAMYLLY